MNEAVARNRFVVEPAAEKQEPQGMALPLDSKHPEPLVETKISPVAKSPPPAVETANALVVTDFQPPETTLSERIVRFAYRLGVSGSTLTAPFRKPTKPRLLATVESPLAGDRVAGMALRAGHFLVLGVKTPIAQVDFSPAAKLPPPFERVVHGFTWLRDLEASPPRAQCTHTAERVLLAWLDVNGTPGKGVAWKVGNAGHRLLNWLVHAPLILSSPDKALRARILSSEEETARWLDRNVGKASDTLEALAGWCAIIAAGLLMPDGKPRRLFGEVGLARALGELIGSDGGVLSRSPLAQIEAISLLTELSACYHATRRDPPRAVTSMLQTLVPPLLALTHSDGGLGNWQGAGAIPASRISALIEASGVRTRPLRDARQWGYQRVTAGKAILQFDAAPPPLARHARHGCASTLAFELSQGEHRLIVNCGGAALAGGQVPARIEQGLRATAAHSSLVLGDANSTAVLVAGKLGQGVGEVEVDRRMLTADGGAVATRLEASHDGYVSRFGLVHRRILILRDDGSELRGEDLLVPAGRKGKRGKVPYSVRFHLGPGIEVGLSSSGRGATLALPDGGYWQFLAVDHELEIDESLWVDGEGRPHPVQQLVMQGLASRGGASFSWLLKKIR